MGTNRATRIATAAALAVAITPLWTGMASAQTGGGSICGTVWRDTDGDGLRSGNEPAIAGTGITLRGEDFYATTDTDGKYCLTGLPAGEHVVVAMDRAGEGDGWTRQITGGDSDVAHQNGYSEPITLTEGGTVEGVDAGYVRAEMDIRVWQLVVDYPDGRKFALDQNWLPGPVTVGDVFTIHGSITLEGNVYEWMRAALTVPAGLSVVGEASGMPVSIEGQTAHGGFPERRWGHDTEWIGLTVRVDAPFDASEIRLQALPGDHADGNPDNNVLTGAISAVAAPVATTSPAPTTTVAPVPQASGAKASGPELADTGVDPAVGLAVGVGLLGGGAGALWYSRRRGLTR